MEYKAYIVYASVATRVIVPKDAEEEEIYKAAFPQVVFNLKYQGLECMESFEEDTEVPFDPLFDGEYLECLENK